MSTLDLRHDPDIVRMDRRRGHRFQPPKADLARIPKLYATEATPTAEKIVHLHYFVGGWDWYVVEIDPETFEAFGLVRSPICPEGEWGSFDLADLALASAGALVNDRHFQQPVERDKWWNPTPITEVTR